MFKENHLEIGRTILIAPDANSIAEGPESDFWITLVNKLKNNGYQVCTNLSKMNGTPIEGTQGVFIPYKMLNAFLMKCKSFIGYRSGLCDLIATIQCKKVIVYPVAYWPVYKGLNIGTTLDIFSLKNVEFDQELLELEYQKSNKQVIIEEIIEYVCSH